MANLEGKVVFFQGAQDKGKFKGFVRMSPNRFLDAKDGDFIMGLLQSAKASPVFVSESFYVVRTLDGATPVDNSFTFTTIGAR